MRSICCLWVGCFFSAGVLADDLDPRLNDFNIEPLLRMRELGGDPGTWSIVSDATHRDHRISPHVIEHVLLPAINQHSAFRK